MLKSLLAAAFLVSAAFAGVANAQEIVKKEPPAGALKQGQYVFVDNGACPKGQLQKVAAGAFAGSGKSQRGAAAARTRSCEKHP